VSKVITLTGLRLGAAPAVGGSCASRYAKEIVINGKTYCQSTETGQIYDPVTMEEYDSSVKGSKLLNYGLAMGVGAVVGLMFAAMNTKKGGARALGAAAGAGLSALVLFATWPKMPTPQA
jgi:hypothetical protein